MGRGYEVFSSFDSIFREALTGKQESWSYAGSSLYVEIELAGTDPKTISVARRGPRTVVVKWTDRHGATRRREWELQPVFNVTARFRNGLLRITAELQPTPPELQEIPVKLEIE